MTHILKERYQSEYRPAGELAVDFNSHIRQGCHTYPAAAGTESVADRPLREKREFSCGKYPSAV